MAASCSGTPTISSCRRDPYASSIHALSSGRPTTSGSSPATKILRSTCGIRKKDIGTHMSGYEGGKVKFLSFDHTSRWLATSGSRDMHLGLHRRRTRGREPTMLPHEAPSARSRSTWSRPYPRHRRAGRHRATLESERPATIARDREDAQRRDQIPPGRPAIAISRSVLKRAPFTC